MAIYEHLMKIGFDLNSAKSVEEKIRDLANQYINKEEAISAFSETFTSRVNKLFSNTQLDTFLRVMRKNSFQPDESELEKELGWGDLDFNMLTEAGELSESEIKEYLQERKEYVQKTRKERELRALNSMPYEILTRINYRQSKEPLGLPSPPIRMIPTPMGGMGGWRRKMKIR